MGGLQGGGAAGINFVDPTTGALQLKTLHQPYGCFYISVLPDSSKLDPVVQK
jgi:hypothetical protein